METQLELQMTDQQSDSYEAKLTLSLTGNPWTDFGIISLCAELRLSDPPFLVGQPFLTENDATIIIDVLNIEMVEPWFNQMLRDKWNDIYHPSQIAKVLNKLTLTKEDGFIKPSETILIHDADRAVIKEKLKRRREIEDEELFVERRTNFVGVPGNIETIQKRLDSIVHESVESLINPSGRNLCEVSGLSFKKTKDVSQYTNPFANKYHNNPIRGVTSRAGYTKVSPIHYLVSLLTTLCPNTPFVREGEIVTLILPVIPDLHLLSEVYARLIDSNNLKDFNNSKEINTFTNLRELRPPYDDYSLAIYIFHNIFYRFSEEAEWSIFEEIDEPEPTRRLLTRWVKIPFTRPSPNRNQRNIRFGNFHYIDVDHRLYDFIRPIPFGDDDEIRLVPDIIARISPVLIKGKRSPRGENSLRYLSKAIATSDTRLMKVAIFNLWKHTDAINVRFGPQPEAPHPLQMLRYFIQYFLEVNIVSDEKLRDDLRALGHTIGSVFSRDVTLISKLYNISSEGAFRAVLRQVMFRLYKVGLDGKAEDGKIRVKVKNEEKSITRVSRERVTRILDELTQENWSQIAETLSTFTSLSAFNENFSQRQATGGKNG